LTEHEALEAANSALDALDTATTEAGNSVSSIQARIDELIGEIRDNPNTSAEITALAEKASLISGRLGPIAESLKAMGKVEEPVPVPIPPEE
jgi:chromosome segregation ATPase